MALKDVIVQIRNEAGITQEGMARRLYVTRQAVSRWETGETAPGPEAQQLVRMHAAWLQMYWPEGLYTPEVHRSLADGYLADERFQRYYEAVAPGATQFLRDAVHVWA